MMNMFRFWFRPLVFCMLSLLLVSAADAQATRTFVSALGKDSNSCDSPSRPCRQVSAALAKVQPDGEVVMLDSGSYQPFEVTKAVTVGAAPGVHAGITVLTGDGISIHGDTAPRVVLRGLALSGQGGNRGILFTGAGTLLVENCVVRGFGLNSGILFAAVGDARLFVEDSLFTDNDNAIAVAATGGTAVASINRSRVLNNFHGIWARENSQVTIRDSVAAGNSARTLWAAAAPAGTTAELNIESCVVTGNSDKGVTAGSDVDLGNGISIVRVSNSTLTNNGAGVYIFPGANTVFSRGNNTVEGNGVDGSFTGTFSAK